MSDKSPALDDTPITPMAYWQEHMSAWTDFSQRAGTIIKKQISRTLAKDATDEVSLTSEMLRTLSDFNLRRWQNTARVLDTIPEWKTGPSLASLINGVSITDWFDRMRRTDVPNAFTPATAPKPQLLKPTALTKPDGRPDDLTNIKGIGPKLSSLLNQLGIYHFKQIASWSEAEAAWVEDHLAYKGRITRENWISQALKIAANGAATLH